MALSTSVAALLDAVFTWRPTHLSFISFNTHTQCLLFLAMCKLTNIMSCDAKCLLLEINSLRMNAKCALNVL